MHTSAESHAEALLYSSSGEWQFMEVSPSPVRVPNHFIVNESTAQHNASREQKVSCLQPSRPLVHPSGASAFSITSTTSMILTGYREEATPNSFNQVAFQCPPPRHANLI